MKKLIILLFISTYSLSSFGQDSVKTRNNEFYLTIANFSPVNVHLKYKRQIVNKIYFKVGLVNLSASSNKLEWQTSTSFPISKLSYSGGIEAGIEFRKQLTKRFSLFHGPNLSFTYRETIFKISDPSLNTKQQKNITQSYSGVLPYSLGILFNLNANMLVAAEINPNIYYSYEVYKNGRSPQANNTSNNISIGFDNKIVLLSFVYRI
ncbi:MAG: hypothetical protein ABI315_09660 [Bacteroidia bacterium]